MSSVILTEVDLAVPARARVLAVLTACALVITLPAVADRVTGPLHIPAPPSAASASSPSAAQHRAARPLAGKAATPAAVSPEGAAAAPESAPSDTLVPTASPVVPAKQAPAKAKKSARKPARKASTKKARGKKAATKRGAHRGAKVVRKKVARRTAAHKKVVKRPATKRATKRTAAKHAPAMSARRHPGWVTAGHYIRSLRGHGRDVGAMRALGMQDASRNPSGAKHLVLMDIGGQVTNGVHLSTTHHFISYHSLVSAMNAYVDGYHARQRGNAPVTIAIGTNNDMLVNTGTGRAWARQVVNPIRSHSSHYAQITIAGSNDIEPGFRGTVAETRAWMNAYFASTTAPLVFNGSADGCSWSRPISHCNGGWSSRDLAQFAGGMAPGRIIALPQVYNSAMAGQWAQIARVSVLGRHGRLNIVGPLTENRACGSDPYCPTMPSWQAYRRLNAALSRVNQPPADMPYQVDLDVR